MADDLHTLVVGREAMACRFELSFNAGEVQGDTELALAALDLVDEIEARISIYQPTSELSRINAEAAKGWTHASPDTMALLARARDLTLRTHGGFDMASGAIVRSWGFLQRQGRVPDADGLAAARAASGMAHVQLDRDQGRVRFDRPGVELNPGAIGKGWALDHVARLLVARGVPSCLAHGGQSSVLARGIHGPDHGTRRGWHVGLRHPLRPGRRLATLRLDNEALATSGSGTQFFVDRGRRLGHILDPRTGLPAEGVISASVMTPSAADADALATALFVLGPAGLPLIAHGDTAAVLILPADHDGLRVVVANARDDAITFEPEPGLQVEWIGDAARAAAP